MSHSSIFYSRSTDFDSQFTDFGSHFTDFGTYSTDFDSYTTGFGTYSTDFFGYYLTEAVSPFGSHSIKSGSHAGGGCEGDHSHAKVCYQRQPNLHL